MCNACCKTGTMAMVAGGLAIAGLLIGLVGNYSTGGIIVEQEIAVWNGFAYIPVNVEASIGIHQYKWKTDNDSDKGGYDCDEAYVLVYRDGEDCKDGLEARCNQARGTGVLAYLLSIVNIVLGFAVGNRWLLLGFNLLCALMYIVAASYFTGLMAGDAEDEESCGFSDHDDAKYGGAFGTLLLAFLIHIVAGVLGALNKKPDLGAISPGAP